MAVFNVAYMVGGEFVSYEIMMEVDAVDCGSVWFSGVVVSMHGMHLKTEIGNPGCGGGGVQCWLVDSSEFFF